MIKKKELQTIVVYTDGSARGNPGPGGYGTIISYNDGECIQRVELSEGYRHTTNNRMEILGVIEGFEWINDHIDGNCQIDIYSDSQYVVNAFVKDWITKWIQMGWTRGPKREKVKNSDLWKKLIKVMGDHEVYYHWVKGHDTNVENNRCDELAVLAALQDDEFLNEDNGYNVVTFQKKKM